MDKNSFTNAGAAEETRVSEAESTLAIMERLETGSTIVALIGTGQEINRGEAGIKEWIKALEWCVAELPRAQCGGRRASSCTTCVRAREAAG